MASKKAPATAPAKAPDADQGATVCPVGSLVIASKVTRPNGREVVVTGGQFVLDEAGTFLVDGQEVQAR